MTTSAIDFTPFTRQGFMFTPEKYTGEYESIGLITIERYAEGRLREVYQGDALWLFSDVSLDTVLIEAHARATAMGADAMMNVSIRPTTRKDASAEVPGIELSGFAIRRRR